MAPIAHGSLPPDASPAPRPGPAGRKPAPSTQPEATAPADPQANTGAVADEGFEWTVDRFADAQVLRYQVPGFDELDLQRKQLLYYLYEAALSGRDIIYDQKFAGNLSIRRTLEAIIRGYAGPREDPEFVALHTYAKRVWFSNGIHHHYSGAKFEPGFSREWFETTVRSLDPASLPLAEGQSVDELLAQLGPWIFDPAVAPKRTNQDPKADPAADSANNFYGEGVTAEEVEAFYSKNLPNANWIRAEHGSKSVNLGNIVAAYDAAKEGNGLLEEFTSSEEELARAREHGALASKLHVDMHEVIGHASGRINAGVGTPKETLKSYSQALEEARADLVALYYAIDPHLVELGLMPSVEVGKAEYDSYIRNGMMVQLARLEIGEQVEEAHMRNRQLVAAWAYEKGKADKVIEKKVNDGKTYFVINDYDKLRELFGQLLREIQRIKSEGDYEAGKALIETYAVEVDPDLHAEVKRRYDALDIAPYSGFLQPRLVPVMEGDEIVDVELEYAEDFTQQMLEYGERYSLL